MVRGNGPNISPCPVCGREMVAGLSVDRHHWLPKSKGGRNADLLHLICHRKIHSLFSRKELATEFGTPEAVAATRKCRNSFAGCAAGHPSSWRDTGNRKTKNE